PSRTRSRDARVTPSTAPGTRCWDAVSRRRRRASVEEGAARGAVVEVDLSVLLEAAVERLPARPVRGTELHTPRNEDATRVPEAQVLSLRRNLDQCFAGGPGLEADLVDAARRSVVVLVGEACTRNRTPARLAVAASTGGRLGSDQQGGIGAEYGGRLEDAQRVVRGRGGIAELGEV